MDQFVVRIEGAQQSSFIKAHVGLNLLERFSVTKNEASIAVSSPQNGTARRVESKKRLRFGKLNVMAVTALVHGALGAPGCLHRVLHHCP